MLFENLPSKTQHFLTLQKPWRKKGLKFIVKNMCFEKYPQKPISFKHFFLVLFTPPMQFTTFFFDSSEPSLDFFITSHAICYLFPKKLWKRMLFYRKRYKNIENRRPYRGFEKNASNLRYCRSIWPFAVYTIHYTVYSIHYTVYSIQYTEYSIQYTVYSIQYTL